MMPNYPIHTIEHAKQSLHQLRFDRDLNIVSEDAYAILRRKIEQQILALRRRERFSAVKIGSSQ